MTDNLGKKKEMNEQKKRNNERKMTGKTGMKQALPEERGEEQENKREEMSKRRRRKRRGMNRYGKERRQTVKTELVKG